MLTHANIMGDLVAARATGVAMTQKDVHISYLPLAHMVRHAHTWWWWHPQAPTLLCNLANVDAVFLLLNSLSALFKSPSLAEEAALGSTKATSRCVAARVPQANQQASQPVS